jgi:hypothetical protein
LSILFSPPWMYRGAQSPWSAPRSVRGQSVAGFVEALVDRALADAGLIEQPNDVAAARR